MPPRLFLLLLLFVVACSSESTLVGQGACEGYCFKIVGAKCKASPTHDDCIDECLFYQGECAREWNDWLRCATIDATIACDSATTLPKVVGCDKFHSAVVPGPGNACMATYSPDASAFDAP